MMNKFNDIIEQISKEDIIQYYIEENHSFVESAEHFGVKGGMFARLIKYYAIKKSKEKHSERIAITKVEAADLLKNSQKKWEREKYDTWCVRDTEKQLIAVKK